MSAGTATRDNAGLLLAQLGSGGSTIGAVGAQTQAANTKVTSARSSIYWPGLYLPVNTAAQAAEVGNWVAIPVTPGDVFENVGVVGGSASAATVAEYITALYVGAAGGALLAQSASATPGSHPKEELYVSKLASPVTITKTNAPKGYVYAMVAAGSVGTGFSFMTMTMTTASQAILALAGGPGAAATALCAKGGSSLKGTAESVVPTLTAVANVPMVVLY